MVIQDLLEILDHKVLQEIVECLDFQAQADNRVYEDSGVLLVSQVNRGNLVTMDHKVYQELLVLRDLQVQRVIRVSKGRLESRVRQELQDASEIRARLVHQVLRVYRVLQVFLALLDRRVRSDRPVNVDCEVKRVRR